MNSQTEKLRSRAPPAPSRCCATAPADGSAAAGVAVIAHPHPLFGGTMDNKVVQTLARAFVGLRLDRGALQLPRRRRQRRRARRRARRVRGHAGGGRSRWRPTGRWRSPAFPSAPSSPACASQPLWGARDIRAGRAGRHGSVARSRSPPLPRRRARAHAGGARRAGRHGAAGRRDGLGAAAVTSCHSRPRGRPFLSRTIAAAQESGGPPPARGLVSRLRFPPLHESFFERAARAAAGCRRCRSAWSPRAQVPAPPEVAARSYLLLDVTANQMLAQKDIDSPVEPASLTKLMSAYLVFDALRAKKITLTQTLPVSARAWKMPGSRMFIDPKMQVPVEDLIKGLIVQSGNDATVALAEGVGGTVEHFVELMNEQAKALGMKNTDLQEPRRPDRARPHHHGARPEHPGDPPDARLPGVRAVLRDQEVPLPGHAVDQRHQPQPAAVPRPDRRRPEDRPHRRGRLLHDRHRQARLPEPDRRPPPAVDRAGRRRARTRAPTSRRSC